MVNGTRYVSIATTGINTNTQYFAKDIVSYPYFFTQSFMMAPEYNIEAEAFPSFFNIC